MTKPADQPEQSQKPDTPPGQEADPGRGTEDAPGQQKPRADQGLPEEQPVPGQELPEEQP